jgi:hypothetical protein
MLALVTTTLASAVPGISGAEDFLEKFERAATQAAQQRQQHSQPQQPHVQQSLDTVVR